VINRLAAIALTVAALFLIVMAVLVNSPTLFYMATAIVVTLAASRLQAWVAVRGLRFERNVPPAVTVGELVEIAVTVWSERRIQRPLVTIVDGLPKRLVVAGLTAAVPIAPSFDQPIQSTYRFRPLRRGRYKWSGLTVYGTDALGLVTMSHHYTTDPVDLTVYPSPVPISVEVAPSAGWGSSDLETGRAKGSGLEPAGTREYVEGDPIRFVHWAASARTGRVMVKEFESGTGSSLAYFLQRDPALAAGSLKFSPFEAMCGHAMYLATDHVRRGGLVYFPQAEDEGALMQTPDLRERNVREVLTDVQPDSSRALSEEVAALRTRPGQTLLLFVAVQDHGLPVVLAGLSDARKVVIAYDPGPYGVSGASAAEPGYIQELERAGARVYVAPYAEVGG
jgi:uncharacterized protein (DUF58 family)